MTRARLRELARHQQDGTYYVKRIVGGWVNNQIHPDGLVWLKASGFVVGSTLPTGVMHKLAQEHWLYTKNEVPYWGEIDWAPEWYQIGRPRQRSQGYFSPHFTSKSAEDELREARRLVQESRREAEAASKAVAQGEKVFWQSSQRVNNLAAEFNRQAEAYRTGELQLQPAPAKALPGLRSTSPNRKARASNADAVPPPTSPAPVSPAMHAACEHLVALCITRMMHLDPRGEFHPYASSPSRQPVLKNGRQPHLQENPRAWVQSLENEPSLHRREMAEQAVLAQQRLDERSKARRAQEAANRREAANMKRRERTALAKAEDVQRRERQLAEAKIRAADNARKRAERTEEAIRRAEIRESLTGVPTAPGMPVIPQGEMPTVFASRAVAEFASDQPQVRQSPRWEPERIVREPVARVDDAIRDGAWRRWLSWGHVPHWVAVLALLLLAFIVVLVVRATVSPG